MNFENEIHVRRNDHIAAVGRGGRFTLSTRPRPSPVEFAINKLSLAFLVRGVDAARGECVCFVASAMAMAS
ncbi:MAG: hypothetical protein B7X93_04665 [Hydrogenophilales bacterium 17-61-9]|nr:MAG: hypothetical protein B7X93_04665 [Hydrogenophilales bacterium 17-61-9]